MKTRSLISLCGAALLATACSQTDTGITTSVKSQLIKDDTVKARQIDVSTRDHVVTLTGNVNTSEEESKALQIARSTRGVSSVVDRIDVGPQPGQAQAPASEPLGERLSDASLTATVKTKLLADPDTSGLRIDVDTKDKVVTLTGKVKSQAEKGEAVQIARNTEGVRSVNDQLTIERRQ